MPILSTLRYHNCESYLHVHVEGIFREEDTSPIVDEVIRACQLHNPGAVLFDMQSQTALLDSTVSYGLARFRVAEAIAGRWPRNVSLAIVESPERFVQDYLFEAVADHHGVTARVFPDPDEAARWLRSVIPAGHSRMAS